MDQTNEKKIKKTKSLISKADSTEKKDVSTKSNSTKKAATSKATTTKKATSKTTAAKKETSSKTTTAKKATSKTTAAKKETSSKTATAKKATSKTTAAKKETASKTATTKKATSKTTAAKKETSSKTTTAKRRATVSKAELAIENTVSIDTPNEMLELQKILNVNENTNPVEYYDLPYRYNQTIIKILAQTPHSIFLYWDVADTDRQLFIDKYGDDFFNTTKPILLVHNKTQNYSFEIEVDDFTNSWYLRTPTSNCVFEVELGRKKIDTYDSGIKFGSIDNRLHISVSNAVESPNDHIINDFPRNIYFKNVKTNELEERKVSGLSNIKNLYKDYELEDSFINNPSSDFRI